MSEKEHIEDVPHGSEKEQEVLEALRASFLDRKFDSSWRPAKVQLIANNTLVDEYQEKKQDFLVRGRKNEELKEKCGFFVENNVAILELITRMGLQGRDSEYNALGYNRMGVYLCKHGDVCLQHALVKHSGSLVMRMVMCKYVAGRPTTAIPRVASAAEFIEPTQGFDCHESVINPDPRDSLQNKFDRSQVYLYEINKLLQPSPRPRQVQPYAVVSFTQNGAYLPIIDAEATAAERMASTVAQQNIANIINSKETLTPQPGAAAAAVMANPGPGIIGPAPVGAGGPQAPSPSGGGGGGGGGAVVVQNTSPPAVVTPIGPTLQQNGINGHMVSPTGDDKDPVKNAVSQLNVKLGYDGKKDNMSRASPAVNRQFTPSPAPLPHVSAPNQIHSFNAPHPSIPHGHNHRLVRLPNNAGQGVFLQPYQNLPGMVPGAIGGAQFPGGLPAGLMAAQPGLLPAQPALAHGQPGLFPGQPGLFSAPPGMFHAQAGLVPGQPGLFQGQPSLIQGQPGLMAGQPGLIAGQPGLMAGQPGLIAGQPGLLPGGQQMLLPMTAPYSVGKPASMGMLPGYPMFSMAGLMGAGGVPTTKTTTATQLGQSRPITPEVPTAGYVANNVSGYTPAIMGNAPGTPNMGQPIPVLTNGTVQNMPGSQPGMQQVTQQMMTAGLLPGMPGMPGVQMLSALPGTTAAPGVFPASYPGLVSQAAATQVPQFTYIGAPGQQFSAVPQGVQKLGQNGLLQPAVLPLQPMPAQSLKRPIADPYGVIDKRIRLA